MINRPQKTPVPISKGVTLIEILLALGLLIILVSFAMPSVSGAVGKAEMKSTLENVRYSIQAARRTARVTETRELGWQVGFIETDDDLLFYALNIEGEQVWEDWPPHKRSALVLQLFEAVRAP